MYDPASILNSSAGQELLAGRFPVREAGMPGIPDDTTAEVQQALDVLFLDAHFVQLMSPVAAARAVASIASVGLVAALDGSRGPQDRAAAREFIAEIRDNVLTSPARQARAVLPVDLDADLGEISSDPHGCF